MREEPHTPDPSFHSGRHQSTVPSISCGASAESPRTHERGLGWGPLNLPDPLYGMLFFAYGYGLYARRELIALSLSEGVSPVEGRRGPTG